VRIGGDVDVLEDLLFVPDVIAGGDDVCAEIKELFGDGGCEAEASSGVFAVDDEEIDGVGFDEMREVLVRNVAACGAENVAYKQNLHWTSLYGCKILGGIRPIRELALLRDEKKRECHALWREQYQQKCTRLRA
jgi:hypothetical protein